MAKKNNSLVPSYEKEFHSGSRWDFYKARRQKEALDNEKWDSFQRKRMRSREKREYASGMLSRGIAIILAFVFAFFAFNLLSLSLYGSQSSRVVSLGGSYDGSDVSLQSYRFSSSSSAFDAVEDGFSVMSGFTSFISSTVSSVAGFIFGSVVSPIFSADDPVNVFILTDGEHFYYYLTQAHEIFWGYSFIVGITKLPCGLTNVNLPVSYAKVHTKVLFVSQKLVFYSASGKSLGEYLIYNQFVTDYSHALEFLSSEFGLVVLGS